MYTTEFEILMSKEFGDFDKIQKFFRPTLNENPTHQEKYIYMKNHDRYSTMNNWNNVKSYSNNVKIHNLGFGSKQENNYHEINSSNFNDMDKTLFYDEIYQNLYLFSKFYNYQYKINFNGAQGGYLVIYKLSKDNKLKTIPGEPVGNDYADYSESEFDDFFELVYNFDLICDIVRHNVNLMLSTEIEEYEIPQPTIIAKRFFVENNDDKYYGISVNEGLNNSQSYTRDETNNSTLAEINFNDRLNRCLNVENVDSSRKDFSNLIRDCFTHYRNIRASKEKISFWDIGKEFFLKYKNK